MTFLRCSVRYVLSDVNIHWMLGKSTLDSYIPMTHAPETGAENQLHFSVTGFWYVCHTNLGLDLSGNRNRRQIEQCSLLPGG